MITLTLLPDGFSVQVQGATDMEVIRAVAFYAELPKDCPVCRSPIYFTYREAGAKKHRYYGLRCNGDQDGNHVRHETDFGQYQDQSGLYYKGDSNWEVEYKVRNGGQSNDSRERAEETPARPSNGNGNGHAQPPAQNGNGAAAGSTQPAKRDEDWDFIHSESDNPPSRAQWVMIQKKAQLADMDYRDAIDKAYGVKPEAISMEEARDLIQRLDKRIAFINEKAKQKT